MSEQLSISMFFANVVATGSEPADFVVALT